MNGTCISRQAHRCPWWLRSARLRAFQCPFLTEIDQSLAIFPKTNTTVLLSLAEILRIVSCEWSACVNVICSEWLVVFIAVSSSSGICLLSTFLPWSLATERAVNAPWNVKPFCWQGLGYQMQLAGKTSHHIISSSPSLSTIFNRISQFRNVFSWLWHFSWQAARTF